MRQKQLFNNNADEIENLYSKTSIFKSFKSAPIFNEIKELEKDIFDMINNVNFNIFTSKFHKKYKLNLKGLRKKRQTESICRQVNHKRKIIQQTNE